MKLPLIGYPFDVCSALNPKQDIRKQSGVDSREANCLAANVSRLLIWRTFPYGELVPMIFVVGFGAKEINFGNWTTRKTHFVITIFFELKKKGIEFERWIKMS